jgi:hypothetical protein
VQIRQSPARYRLGPAAAGRAVADHQAGECHSRPAPVRVDARVAGRPQPARSAPSREAAAAGWAARAVARPAA